MNSGLLHAHSGLRWVVLLALIYAIYDSVQGKKKGLPFSSSKLAGTIAVALLHIQVILGLVMYFQSRWFDIFRQVGAESFSNPESRFYILEHPVLMIIAAFVATIGNAKAKKAISDTAAFRKRLVWFTVTLVLILIAIPWPFRFENAGWF